MDRASRAGKNGQVTDENGCTYHMHCEHAITLQKHVEISEQNVERHIFDVAGKSAVISTKLNPLWREPEEGNVDAVDRYSHSRAPALGRYCDMEQIHAQKVGEDTPMCQGCQENGICAVWEESENRGNCQPTPFFFWH
jgi:hypothetical protein